MGSSPPTRLDDEVYAAAQAAARSMHRSVAQQLSHWARLGREVEASTNVDASRRAVAEVLNGQASYDELRRDEQAQVRAEWAARIAQRIDEVDIGAARHRAGRAFVALDEEGRVVQHQPDGNVEVL